MTPEARLDRLERIAMLFARAGDRARKQFREQLSEHDRLINHMFDLQIKNEEKFAQNEERFARNEQRFAQNEERFAKLVESQAGTDRRLNSLIEVIKKGPNGDDTRDSQA
jgi:uncharacterized protein HemX